MSKRDIAARLRRTAALEGTWYANVGRKTAQKVCAEAAEAADYIERLEAALRAIADGSVMYDAIDEKTRARRALGLID